MLVSGAVCAILALLLTCGSVAQANIIGQTLADDGDGKISCTAIWDAGTSTQSIDGIQSDYPGHMVGSFDTDSELDPTVTMINFIDNDTTFTWTDYHVIVYMNKTFQLSAPSVYGPSGWTSNMTQPLLTPSTIYDGDGNLWSYSGVMNFYAGTPVPNDGSTLSFGYKMSFLGSILYAQEMIPTPEPATLGLLAFGGLVLLRRRK